MTTASTMPLSTILSNQQSQPEQKKSRFGLGSLFSDGLNVLGSGVNSIKSTATNLAGGAVGVVGGVVGAAAAAAAQSSQSTGTNQNSNQNSNQNQNNNQVNVQNTTSGTSITTNQTSFTSQPQPSLKLKKQEYAIIDEENNDDIDPYGAKQVDT